MSDRLDKLLGQHLSEPADSGFSARTMIRIIDAQQRDETRIAMGYGVTIVTALCALFYLHADDIASHIVLALTKSPFAAVAAFVLIMSGTAYRVFRDG